MSFIPLLCCHPLLQWRLCIAGSTFDPWNADSASILLAQSMSSPRRLPSFGAETERCNGGSGLLPTFLSFSLRRRTPGNHPTSGPSCRDLLFFLSRTVYLRACMYASC
ncbi:uncharacterized protein CCOS01_07398 [Colletotrichum costaricense]|uniref:Secreted protein n=2 Tax=Colletotrichum acutatum species complex TaxID=2707335 RepID=A0AAI9YXM6_9PEZI|nr:uncharacterized protein CCOS01_07398 [Colletotrichum costaricense]XP_060381914.1 uncharacterized protein CTAM01_07516 [Colletotrichum tamarilloi]KAK1498298.1 hypothetical protein CTAM01_07516 [Colletotrichum tamarilloi]KAK1527136.1 hypothetical protein CCOS01_07398 [Colletotrichum costaricense]